MKRKQCMEEEERFFSFFSFFSTSASASSSSTHLSKNRTPPRKKNENSHVRLLLPLHALRLGDPAAQLHPARVPREQRVRPAQPDAAVVGGEERRRERPLVVIFGSCCSRRRRSCSVDVSGARERGGGASWRWGKGRGSRCLSEISWESVAPSLSFSTSLSNFFLFFVL